MSSKTMVNDIKILQINIVGSDICPFNQSVHKLVHTHGCQGKKMQNMKGEMYLIPKRKKKIGKYLVQTLIGDFCLLLSTSRGFFEIQLEEI